MDNYIVNDYMKNALIRTTRALARVEKEIREAPEGFLLIKKPKGKQPVYYHAVTTDGKKKVTYINKENREIAKKLAQKSYDIDIRECLEREIQQIKSVGEYRPEEKYKKYGELTDYRKELVKPFRMLSDSDVAAWKNKYKKRNTYKPEELIHFTKKGEARRSKSERDISDVLDSYADIIEYVYEPFIKLRKGEKSFCPDFLILNKMTGDVYYWEHFGGFGFDNYAEDFVLKMQMYNAEGPEFTGRLISTYESGDHPLQPDMIKGGVERIINPK